METEPLEGSTPGSWTLASSPYALRHTFCAFEIAAGTPTFEIARMMGTSIEMIDKTYGHLLAVSAEVARARMDAFDHRS